jgi:SNF2 family DNA or RNA helicase
MHKVNRYLERGTVTNNYASVLVMLLRLRQLCCHPKLIKDLGVQASTEGIAEDTLLDRAKLLTEDVVKRLMDASGFECPICFETDANPTIVIPCGHTTCGECFQKLIDPSRAVRDGDENSGVRCPNCRGTLSADKITDYQHFCKVFCPNKLQRLQKMGLGNGEDSMSEAGSDSDTDSDSDESNDGTDSLDGFVVPDSEIDIDDVEGTAQSSSDTEHKDKVKAKIRSKDKGTIKGKLKLPVTLAQLKKESLRNNAAKKKYLKRLRKNWESSAKIDKTIELLTNIRAADPTEKTLVFSQFTSLLDLLEVPLSERKFKYQRYDGSMRMDDRAEAVNQFMDVADENIMLVSLKAGNAGLNLSKASQVIMLDPFWSISLLYSISNKLLI